MIYDLLRLLGEIWQDQPAVVVLSGLAVVVLIYVLVDTHRHRRKHKRRTPERPHDRLNHRDHP